MTPGSGDLSRRPRGQPTRVQTRRELARLDRGSSMALLLRPWLAPFIAPLTFPAARTRLLSFISYLVGALFSVGTTATSMTCQRRQTLAGIGR